jgi:hypothetical protein
MVARASDGDAEVTEFSGRRRRAYALASVRRPNCMCGFPAAFTKTRDLRCKEKATAKWALLTSGR